MMNVGINSETFPQSYSSTIEAILEHGSEKSPRGQKVKFFQNCLFGVKNPGTVISYKSRKYQEKYLNKELELYFSGDCSAKSFGEASKFWLQLANNDGNINSNYGYLVFYKEIETSFGKYKNQWTFAKEQLSNDKDTRQALIFISSPHVQFKGNKDFICTLSYLFNIEDNKLHLTVNRRSQDMFFGIPYDYAFEYLLLVKMHNELKDIYPELEIGSYNMFCNNIHIYERNFTVFKDMLKDIEDGNVDFLNILDIVDQNILKDYVFNKEFGN